MAAILLAGGQCRQTLQERTGQTERALVPLAERPLIAYALEAVSHARSVSRIVAVAAPATAQWLRSNSNSEVEVVPAADSLIANIGAGFKALGWPERVVTVSCDAPFLSAAALDAMAAAADKAVDVLYPVVDREAMERTFPGTTRTYARLVDGVFTGGNAMLLSRRLVRDHRELMEEVYAARKHPLRLCRMLGFGLLVRLLCRRLAIAQAVDRAEELLQCRVQVLTIPEYPGIAFDVDKAQDLDDAERFAPDLLVQPL